jgi:hypothetical protein
MQEAFGQKNIIYTGFKVYTESAPILLLQPNLLTNTQKCATVLHSLLLNIASFLP